MAIATPSRHQAGRSDGRQQAAQPPAADRIPAVPFDHEELAVRRGARSGLDCVVAVHSTTLGPALGGVRMWTYPGTEDASRDALRLAAGMTHKAAAAGLDLGGGKGVIRIPPGIELDPERRRAVLLDFGDLVESLGGRYVTAEDVGTDPDDLVVIAERTRHVTGLPESRGGSGDPSPFTSLGVEAAMRACCAQAFGDPSLHDRRIAVIGLGRVGSRLARRLAAAGAELVVSDIDPARGALARELGAEWVDPAEAMTCRCDILAPCALGGAIDPANAPGLECRIVCGSANNQLADEDLAADLAARGVLYAPDFIVNAGGLIHVYIDVGGYTESQATELALGIESTLGRILASAEARGITPLEAARALARERLEGDPATATVA